MSRASNYRRACCGSRFITRISPCHRAIAPSKTGNFSHCRTRGPNPNTSDPQSWHRCKICLRPTFQCSPSWPPLPFLTTAGNVFTAAKAAVLKRIFCKNNFAVCIPTFLRRSFSICLWKSSLCVLFRHPDIRPQTLLIVWVVPVRLIRLQMPQDLNTSGVLLRSIRQLTIELTRQLIKNIKKARPSCMPVANLSIWEIH